MAPEHMSKVEELYHAALKRDPAERGAFLDAVCEGDVELRRKVQSLLDADLDTGVVSTSPPDSATSGGTSFSPGATLGQYQITEHLGTGGMGVVYKATDRKLGRTAALKLLRPEMLQDRASVARFEREARTLASLNHPRIATIYGLEEHTGISFLALEYVGGPTLADRLKHGAVRMGDAITIARQIAEALEAAHAISIIHRDLKPANIKVSDDLQIKVLDFGLAKVIHGSTDEAENAATVTETLTENITIMGTAAYMSPEQARGKELDLRTDIWSFGCVLYEMVAGRRAFVGSTLTEILAGVLEREPDWKSLPRETPPRLLLLLTRCLRKDPKDRLRDIGDARIELQELFAGAAHEDTAPRERTISRRTVVAALAGAAVGAASAGGFAIRRYKDAIPRDMTQFAIPAPEPSIFIPSFNRRVAISPDGTRVVFNVVVPGADAFYIRSLASLQSEKVKDISGAAAFFSPDGQSVGFLVAFTGGYGYGSGAASNTLRKLALTGGAPVTVCPVDAFCGGTWGDDGNIYWVDALPGGVMSIPAGGGKPSEVLKPDFAGGERLYKYPYAIQGTGVLLVTLGMAGDQTFADCGSRKF
jgi:eukaryotic-like serine/threonine-protein kinase